MVMASSSLARILGEYSTIHSPPALFVVVVKVEISSRTLLPFKEATRVKVLSTFAVVFPNVQ